MWPSRERERAMEGEMVVVVGGVDEGTVREKVVEGRGGGRRATCYTCRAFVFVCLFDFYDEVMFSCYFQVFTV